MELKFFSDLIEALGKVAGGLNAIVNLSKAERDTMRQTLDEAFRLIDTTLNMVIIRLGDIQLQPTDSDLLREVAGLDNYNEWMRAEREFRLCRSLRVALRETTTLVGKLVGAVSTKDWETLLQQMQTILATENEVAVFIGQQFQQLASEARAAGRDPQRIQDVRNSLNALRAALLRQRQKLIEQELAVFEFV